MTDLKDRYSRQQDIVPAEALAKCRATVIGVGAIGRQVALQLAAIGAPRIQLIDHDVVEAANLATQGYFEDDLGQAKVEATAAFCRRLNCDINIEVVQERYRRSLDSGNAVFCCVDSIETRKHIFESVRDNIEFFVDGRMSAEALRILTATDAAGKEHYRTTLFPAGEAFQGSCTAKSTVFCAGIAAGLMLEQFTRWLRRFPTDRDIQMNLLSTELALTG